jgi:hypothetical protein
MHCLKSSFARFEGAGHVLVSTSAIYTTQAELSSQNIVQAGKRRGEIRGGCVICLTFTVRIELTISVYLVVY